MDDSFFIDLDESDIQQIINDVVIIEERFNENAELRLNQEQILIELTNLLDNKERTDLESLEHKSLIFQKLFKDDSNTTKDINYVNVRPYGDFIKQVLITEDEEEDYDETYQRENNVVVTLQKRYLKQFAQLSKGTTMTYDAVQPQLSLLVKPWIQNQDKIATIFNKPIDIADQKHSIWRILQNENVFVKGVIVNPNNFKEKVFDIQKYFAALQKITEDEEVSLCYNDYLDDITDDRCTHTAVVEKVTKKGIYVNKMFIPFNTYCPVMVFPNGKQNNFNKRQLTHTKGYKYKIIFDPNSSYQTNISFALPISANECLFMLNDIVKQQSNLLELEKVCLKPYGFNLMQIDSPTLRKLRLLLSLKNNTVSNKPIKSDLSRFRYQNDLVNLMIKWKQSLANLKKVKLNQYAVKNKINNEIAELRKQFVPDDCDNTKSHGKIAMRIDSYDFLMDKNVKSFYFDSQHDKTDYKIKDSILREQPKLSEKDLKQQIRTKVLTTYPKLSEADVKFEVASILKGKRKVREGDIAILSLPEADQDIAFKYVDISGEPMWVKILRTPYMKCDDRLVASTSDQNVCVLDTHDNLCKKFKNASINNRIQVLEEQKKLLDLLETQETNNSHDDIINHLRFKAQDFLFRIIDDYVELDDSEYFGDANAVDDKMQIDMNEYGFLIPDEDYDAKVKFIKEFEVIDNMCEILGLDLMHELKENIAAYTNLQCHNLDQTLDKDAFYAAKMAKVNLNMYMSKQKYKTQVDELIATKYLEEKAKLSQTFYYSMYLHVAMYLCCIIMANYPSLVMKSIISSCASQLQYVGYPIKDPGASNSIQNYVACVLKSISLPNDDRLGKIAETPLQTICENMESLTDSFLKTNPRMAADIENNKDNLITYNKKYKDSTISYESIWDGYVPNIKNIKPVKSTKYNIVSEVLFDDVIFERNTYHGTIPRIQTYAGTFFPISRTNKFNPNLFEKSDVLQNNATIIEKTQDEKGLDKLAKLTEINKEAAKNWNDDKWWDTIMYGNVERRFDDLSKAINSQVVINIKGSLLISGPYLYYFMKDKFIAFLSKLLHARLTDSDTEETKYIMLTVLQNQEIKKCLQDALVYVSGMSQYMHVFDDDDVENTIKNNLLLADIFLNTTDILIKVDNTIAKICCENLRRYFENNLINQSSLTQKVESLREARKENLIEKYKANDDERKLQIELKKIGLEAWYDVGEEVPKDEPVVLQMDEVAQEMVAYQGENADDDDEDG